MHVIDGVEIRLLSALRGPFLDARRTFFICFFRYLLSCPHASTSSGKGLRCVVACSRARAAGRRKRRSMPDRLNVGEMLTSISVF